MSPSNTPSPRATDCNDAAWPIPSLRPIRTCGYAASANNSPANSDRWHFGTARGLMRGAAERFIATEFMKAYGARITGFMPELAVLCDSSEMAAVCGLRSAATSLMFLEHYLPEPAETLLSKIVTTPVRRDNIVEVGNLSIARPGYARHLVYCLTMHLHNNGTEWTLFSAVPALLNNFRRLGIPLVSMAPANPDRLPADIKASWGTYYDQLPQVTAVNVAAAHRVLRKKS